MKKTKKGIENSLKSDLNNLLSEYDLGRLNHEVLIGYFSEFLQDADVDSRIIVNVLESNEFGSIGREAALAIKVNEGW